MTRRFIITETATGVAYTASVSVPPGSRILDVIVETFTAWTAASTDIDIGDSDASNALADGIDLTAVQFEPATGLSGSAWGDASGDGAPYSADAPGGTGKLYPNGDLITLSGSATTPGGPTGFSVVTLLIEEAGAYRRAVVT